MGTAIAPDFVKAWADDVKSVVDAYQGNANGRHFFPSEEKVETLFGPEFLALMPAGDGSACVSYFLLGRCRPECTRSHTTRSTPTPQVVAGIRDRMKAHCKQMIRGKTGRRGRT